MLVNPISADPFIDFIVEHAVLFITSPNCFQPDETSPASLQPLEICSPTFTLICVYTVELEFFIVIVAFPIAIPCTVKL